MCGAANFITQAIAKESNEGGSVGVAGRCIGHSAGVVQFKGCTERSCLEIDSVHDEHCEWKNSLVRNERGELAFYWDDSRRLGSFYLRNLFFMSVVTSESVAAAGRVDEDDDFSREVYFRDRAAAHHIFVSRMSSADAFAAEPGRAPAERQRPIKELGYCRQVLHCP